MFDPALLLAQEPSGTIQFIDKLARAPLSNIIGIALVLTVIRLAAYIYMLRTPAELRGGGFKAVRVVNEIMDSLTYAAIVVFLLLRPFLLQTFVIPSGSMIDTLLIRDFIVANKWVYRNSDPQRGDIVVFRPPSEAITSPIYADADFIKRCIGVPGDVVEIRDKQTYINGEPLEEPWATYTVVVGTPQNFDFQVVPENEVHDIPMPDFKLVQDGDRYIPLLRFGGKVNNTQMTVPQYYIASEDEAEMDRLWALPPAAIPEDHYLMIGDNRTNSSDGRSWGLVTRDSIVGKSEAIFYPLSRWQRTR